MTKERCPECGDEYDKCFHIDKANMENPSEAFGFYMDKAFKAYAQYMKSNSGRCITSGDHWTGYNMIIFKGSKEEILRIVDIVEQGLLHENQTP